VSSRRLVALLLALASGCSGQAAEADPILKDWVRGFLPLPEAEIRMQGLETTQEVYARVTGQQPSRWGGDRNSVEMVSWEDAVAFCRKATSLLQAAGLLSEKQSIRLPTEREWEVACRAGTTTAYSFGDNPADLGDYGWYDGNAAGNDPPAGAKKPNPWGFHDFHGYVWEWCSDLANENHVARGGAWTSSAAECRSDSRKLLDGKTRSADLGFRCVLAEVR